MLIPYNGLVITTYFTTAKRKKLQQIHEYRFGSWIHVSQATLEDITQISTLTGLTIPDVDDALDPAEVPRIEYHENALILFVRYPSKDNEPLYTDTLTLIVTDQYFITISLHESSILQPFLESTNPVATTQTTKMLLHILIEVAQSFMRQIKTVQHEVHTQKHTDVTAIKNKDIISLTKTEEVLNEYLSALSPLRTVFEQLLESRFIRFHEDDGDLLEDLLVGIRQSVVVCQVNLKSIQNLRDSYQIIFTNRLNTAIQTLTILTIVLTIPTIIGSFFGMNVPLPFSNNAFAFPLITLFSIGISFVFLWFLRRTK